MLCVHMVCGEVGVPAGSEPLCHTNNAVNLIVGETALRHLLLWVLVAFPHEQQGLGIFSFPRGSF